MNNVGVSVTVYECIPIMLSIRHSNSSSSSDGVFILTLDLFATFSLHNVKLFIRKLVIK